MNQKRFNGRAFNELRPISVYWDPMSFSLSSLVFKTGKTSILCSVSLEDRVPKWLAGQGKGWLQAEYRLLPGSTPVRQKRELTHLSGRTQEIQRLISRTLRSCLEMQVIGEKTLLIDCDVIQADAGTRTASINGGWIVLKRACERLLEKGIISANPIKFQVAAVSVGLVNGMSLLDLDYEEDSNAEVDLNVASNSEGGLLEIQGTAEKEPFSRRKFDELIGLAEKGIGEINSSQLLALNEHF